MRNKPDAEAMIHNLEVSENQADQEKAIQLRLQLEILQELRKVGKKLDELRWWDNWWEHERDSEMIKNVMELEQTPDESEQEFRKRSDGVYEALMRFREERESKLRDVQSKFLPAINPIVEKLRDAEKNQDSSRAKHNWDQSHSTQDNAVQADILAEVRSMKQIQENFYNDFTALTRILAMRGKFLP